MPGRAGHRRRRRTPGSRAPSDCRTARTSARRSRCAHAPVRVRYADSRRRPRDDRWWPAAGRTASGRRWFCRRHRGRAALKISPRPTSNQVLATAVKSPNLRTRSRTTITGRPGFSSVICGRGAGRGVRTCFSCRSHDGCCRGRCPARWGLLLPQHHHEGVLEFLRARPAAGVAEQPVHRVGVGLRLTDEVHRAALRHRIDDQSAVIDEPRRHRAGTPAAGDAVKVRPRARPRSAAGVPSSSSRPACMTNTRAHRSASSM